MKTLALIAVCATLAHAVAVRITGCDWLDKAIQMDRDQLNAVSSQTPSPIAERQTAYFAAGCFWGVEAAFRRIEGVTATAVGYMGGHVHNPTYRQVCGGRTGHAETVRVEYDPKKTSYTQLLDTFWSIHDPTTRNRQGPDVGSQYRSAIFAADEEQYKAAAESLKAMMRSGRFARPIVTEIKKAGPFYMAEEYHQQYLEKQGKAACNITLQ